MNDMTWKPTLPVDQYTTFPYVQDKAAFNYVFRANTVDCYPKIKSSPFGNKEVNRLVFRFLDYADFGKRTNPDMLAITYYAGNYFDRMDKEYSLEIQDLYIQLDKDIEQLLDTLDSKVGLKNTLIVMSGTGYNKGEEVYPDGMQAGGGEFYPKRSMAYLNMYLMALYGQKDWIKGYYNNQIYFNRKTIEDEKLDLADFQKEAAEFLATSAGVSRVTTDMTLRRGIWNNEMADFHRGTHYAGRGDLIIELQPGWRINTEKPGEKVKNTRNNTVQTPLIFMGAGIRPQRIYRDIKATEVAPTITHILRIRPPNACKEIPLYEILHY
jgi:arylsulfatase A-like enzyme